MFLTFRALPPIFEKFPNAEGFLFLKDDVILNYWALLAADKNKLWSLHKVELFPYKFEFLKKHSLFVSKIMTLVRKCKKPLVIFT